MFMAGSLDVRDRLASSLFRLDCDSEREADVECIDRRTGRAGDTSREEMAELEDESGGRPVEGFLDRFGVPLADLRGLFEGVREFEREWSALWSLTEAASSQSFRAVDVPLWFTMLALSSDWLGLVVLI